MQVNGFCRQADDYVRETGIKILYILFLHAIKDIPFLLSPETVTVALGFASRNNC